MERFALALLLTCAAVGCSFDEGPLSYGRAEVDGGPEPGGGRAGDGVGGGGSGGRGGTGGGGGVGTDAGGIAGTISRPMDAGRDAGTDADEDAGVDAGVDAGMDAGVDAAVDAGIDAAVDAGEDAGLDAGVDSGVDAGVDSGPPDVCVPLSTEPCYTGPEGTQGVGACVAGTRTCRADGSGYDACQDEVLPATPSCGAAEDLDCNATPDIEQGVDADGDGYDTCHGDCCDDAADCDAPEWVNPGAYDFASDGIDDDCSGLADDSDGCDAALTSNSGDAVDYARALDLCTRTTASPPLEERTWGLLSAGFSLAAGSGTPAAGQRSIRPDFGAITVQGGASMMVLSSGTAAAVGDTNPAYTSPAGLGVDNGTTSTEPADWIAANDGNTPVTPGCPAPPDGAIYDSVMLTLSVRVPTNAQAFTLRAYFLTSEYAEWVCSFYGDYFVSLLSSTYEGDLDNPADGNLATYVAAPDEVYPISANLPHGNTELFQQCVDGPTGCQPVAVSGTTTSCTGAGELVGTGMELPAAGTCDADALVGGGTGWLQIAGNVVPGETIQLRLAIWDNADGYGDSHVLLDAFSWHAEPIEPGVTVAD